MVDTYDDFKTIKTIFEQLYIKKLFNFRDIEKLLQVDALNI